MNIRILKRIRKKTKVDVIRGVGWFIQHKYNVYINDNYEESYITLSGAIKYAWMEMKYHGLTDKEKKILLDRGEKKNIEDDGQTSYKNY